MTNVIVGPCRCEWEAVTMPEQLPTSPGEVALLDKRVTEAISVQVPGYALEG